MENKIKKSISNIARAWQEELAKGGYEEKITNKKDFLKLKRFSRTWKIIFKTVKLKPDSIMFEFGCGGGNQLLPLALNGYKSYGIDCSKDVLLRFRNLISDVEKYHETPLDIKLTEGDFLDYESNEKYDLVFNFGVIEHFLDQDERERALKKMLSMCKKGGYIVSVVPNGIHPKRQKMREEKLGGYYIPEIDYDCKSIVDEMEKIGAVRVKVIPHNLFSYLFLETDINLLKKIFCRCVYYAAQLLPRMCTKFTCKHAGSLICIGECPNYGLVT